VDVALVVSSFLPRFGGVEEHVLNVARVMSVRRSVVIWAVDQGDKEVPRSVDGIPVRYLSCPLPARTPAALAGFLRAAPGAWRAWQQALGADRPAVLHVHCFGPNGVYAAALARATGTPLVFTTHGETFADADGAFDQSALLRSALRRTVRRADTVTAVSRYAAADIEARFGASDVQIVPNGLNLDEQTGTPPDWLPERYAAAVGRLVGNKGYDLLIEAFARVPATDVELVIGGDGPQREQLARQARHLGVSDRVHLPGRLDRAQVGAVLADAEFLVMPSRAEAFGIAVLEGWRAGIPVIASNRGGPPEFVTHEQDGLLVDPTDVPALAAAMTRVLTEPDLARSLALRGHGRVRDFTWPAVVERYESHYDRIPVSHRGR